MNEQIKQFIKQATIYYPATKSSGEFSIFDKEKFAELIVKECAKQVDGWYDDFENECADRKILKHFEVEENESFDRTASHMAGEYVSYDDLTDEEIWKLWQTHLNDEITVFARAILKEAREK